MTPFLFESLVSDNFFVACCHFWYCTLSQLLYSFQNFNKKGKLPTTPNISRFGDGIISKKEDRIAKKESGEKEMKLVKYYKIYKIDRFEVLRVPIEHILLPVIDIEFATKKDAQNWIKENGAQNSRYTVLAISEML